MSAATDLALAVLLGGAFGIGVCLLLVLVPRWGARRLEQRIAGYIRDIADPHGLTPLGPIGTPTAVWVGLRDRVAGLLGGADAVARRLRQAGRRSDGAGVAAFRARQLAWALAGLAAGGLLVVVLVLTGRFTPAAVLLPPLSAIAAGAGCDLLLTRAARRRAARVAEELPTVLEFVALCLSAGESILDALRRVGAIGAGELTTELRAVVLEIGTGATISEALARLGRGLDVPALTRALDHIVAALDRGAPLAQVLQAQATDAREDAKRGLIERAGQKEIAMLLPLVFMILPLSVLFAVFPGVFMLRLGIG